MKKNQPGSILGLQQLKESAALKDVARKLGEGMPPPRIAEQIQGSHFPECSPDSVVHAVERYRVELLAAFEKKYQPPQPDLTKPGGADIQMMEKLYAAIVDRMGDGSPGTGPLAPGLSGAGQDLRNLALSIKDYIDLRVKTRPFQGPDHEAQLSEEKLRNTAADLALKNPGFYMVLGDPMERHRALEIVKLAQSIDQKTLEHWVEKEHAQRGILGPLHQGKTAGKEDQEGKAKKADQAEQPPGEA